MALTCNIDARGKLARLVWGIILLILAVVVLVVWALPTGGWLPWSVVGFLTVSGAFGIFEARAGWCVVRAMGMKTPM